MAASNLTNFAALTTAQKKVWSRDTWKTARQNSFIMQLAGAGPNSPIQRITELTKTERGDRAVITLVSDLEGDGQVGDNLLEGNEEAIQAYDQEVVIDQIRHANRRAGRMAEQSSVVKFRETSRDVLGFWLADRVDQLAMLTLSGISYDHHTNGALRVGSNLPNLSFAGDVTPPSANRHFRWDSASGRLVPGDTTAVSAVDTPSYSMLVQLKAYASDRRIRPVRAGGGTDVFHVFMHPLALAKLKLDPDFLANLRSAGARGRSNPLFTGSLVTVDGLVIHENTHVYNTLGATAGTATNVGAPGYKWGANADVDGSRCLLLGAQALGYADLGEPEWVEKDFDYGNQYGISTSKIIGFKKPVFYNPKDGADEDFGVIAVDVAI